MTRRRKLGLIAPTIALAVMVAFCWPKPKGYTYQGKTVGEWFEVYLKEVPNPGSRLFVSSVQIDGLG